MRGIIPSRKQQEVPVSEVGPARPRQDEFEVLAELAADLQAASSEDAIYPRLAEALRRVVGEDAILSVSDLDARGGRFRPRVLVGLGALLEKTIELLGRRPEDLSGDFPPGVRQAMASSRMVRVPGGVAELAAATLPAPVARAAGVLLQIADVFVVGFHKGSASGGVCILTRRPDQRLAHGVIESMAHLAAAAIERVRAEAELRRSEARNSAVVSALPDLFFLLSDEGRFLDCQASDPRSLLFPPAEVIGRRLGEVLPADLAARTAEHLQRTLETGSPQRFEYDLDMPGGTRNYEARLTVSGERAVLALVRDLTELRRAEQERERLRAQLVQAQKMESLGRLAGGVAHDFNNMLGVILGNTELALEEHGPAGPLRAFLEEIHQAAVTSADLTRQMLAFARRQTLAPRALVLDQAMEGPLRMLRRLLGEDLELRFSPGAGGASVLLDPTQLEQILSNLCLNARDAIQAARVAGRIDIETSVRELDRAACAAREGLSPGPHAVVRVRDNGGGMDEATRERLFEPFFTTKVLGRGTGLGLSTVHGIVRQHGGQIEAQSAPGQGATFEILLPVLEAGRTARPAEPDRVAVETGRETILLVEDEPAIVKYTSRMLRALGYRVVPAATPGEALRLAREHPGDLHLLLTDVVMPEMNGRELARGLQSLYPDLRCLFMSGYTAEVIAHRGILEEGMHFLQKPFTRAELAAKVREALGQPGDASDSHA
jgi:PAS domain S-box-containing protein